jgi:putative ABC transport system permease protein
MKKTSIPRLALGLFRWMIEPNIRYGAEGDLEERFHWTSQTKGRRRASAMAWGQVASLFPAFLKNSIYWSATMSVNSLKTGYRHLRKHKGFAVINIAGLTVGLALFILLALYIRFELGFDRFHEHRDRIYRVEQILAHESGTENSAGCPTPLSQALTAEFPGFEAVTRTIYQSTVTLAAAADQQIEDRGLFFADPAFLTIFTFPLVKGNPASALSEPGSLLVTESLAGKLFGSEDPIGRTVRIFGERDVKVSGVLKNIPPDSHLQFQAVLSASTLVAWNGPRTFTRWGDNWVPVYVKTAPGHSLEALNAKIRHFLRKYQGQQSRNELYLRPLSRIHLHAAVKFEFALVGSYKNLVILGAVAIFVLLIGVVNFVNLTTARATDRGREIGLRKVVGAARPSLIRQFIAESMLTVIIAMTLALAVARLCLPEFNKIVNRTLSLNFIRDPVVGLALFLLTLVVGFLAGGYPALVLSSYRPAHVFREYGSAGGGSHRLRTALVVFQFAVSISLIIGAAVILRQHRYLMAKDLGYSSEQVIIVPARGSDAEIRTYQQELLRHPEIRAVATSDYPIHSSTNWCYISWEGAAPDSYMKINVNYVDPEFLPAYELRLAAGRNFSQEMRAWKDNAVIINETAARRIGWPDPVGKRLVYNVDYRSRNVGGATVVGVVKDFHFLSLHNPIGPIMLRLIADKSAGGHISVKFSGRDVAGVLGIVGERYGAIFPGSPFSFRFLDEDFSQMYLEEKKAGRIVFYLTVVAIFIACLGLFGLSSYAIRQRTREIGIRKVLGAGVPAIAMKLTRRFLVLVAAANVLAWPIAALVMNNWLKNFPYRISLAWPVFVMSGCAAFLIAAAAVIGQAVRAARLNPAQSLKYE